MLVVTIGLGARVPPTDQGGKAAQDVLQKVVVVRAAPYSFLSVRSHNRFERAFFAWKNIRLLSFYPLVSIKNLWSALISRGW